MDMIETIKMAVDTIETMDMIETADMTGKATVPEPVTEAGSGEIEALRPIGPPGFHAVDYHDGDAISRWQLFEPAPVVRRRHCLR